MLLSVNNGKHVKGFNPGKHAKFYKEVNIGVINKKMIALIVFVLMILNVILPMMLNFVSAAEEYNIQPNSNANYAELEVSYDEQDEMQRADWEENRLLGIDLNLVGNIPVSGIDFNFKYDTSILTPYYWKYNRVSREYTLTEAENGDSWDATIFPTNGGYSQCELDKINGTINIKATRAENNINPIVYNSKLEAAYMLFKVAEGYEPNKIPKTAIRLLPKEGLATGYKIAYGATVNSGYSLNDPQYFGYVNFDNDTKVISKVDVGRNPTKLRYNQGETIDLTGGTIKITYDNKTTGEVSMRDEKVTIQNSIANVENPVIILKYDGFDVKTNINITVNDPIIRVELVTPPTILEYEDGEEISYVGGEVLVTHQSGRTETLSTDDERISKEETIADLTTGDSLITGQNAENEDCGKKTITLSISGFNITYDILVNDTIQSVTAQDYKTTYYIGDTDIDRTQGKLVITTESGYEDEIPFSNGSVKFNGFKTYEPRTDRTITVTYLNQSTTFNIEVKDFTKGISINSKPTQTSYTLGDTTLNLAGGKIDVIKAYTDNNTTKNMTDSEVTVTGFDTSEPGEKIITVEYDGFSATFNITVKDVLDSISIDTQPQTTYYYQNPVNLSQGSIQARYLSNRTLNGIRLNNRSVSLTPIDTSVISDEPQRVTITYTEGSNFATADYFVTVEDSVETMEITKMPSKVEYKFGEELGEVDGEITVTYKSSGETEVIPITSDMITELDGTPFNSYVAFDSGNTVTKNLKISYRDGSAIYEVIIKKPSRIRKDRIVEVSFNKEPRKEYKYFENLEPAEVKITRSVSGEEVELIVASGYDKTKLGTQTLKIQIEEFELTYDVVVSDAVKEIAFTQPTKSNYVQGEHLDLTNGKLIETYLTGKTNEIEITDDMISGFDSEKSGEQYVTVSYDDKKYTFKVNVEKKEEPEENKAEEEQKPVNNNTESKTNTSTPTIPTVTSNTKPVEEKPKDIIPIISNDTNEKNENKTKQDEKDKENTLVIGTVDDNNNNKKQSNGSGLLIPDIIALTVSLLTLLIIGIVRKKGNVSIYIEQGNERVLVGKEKITDENTNIDISKYTEKYGEDNFSIVLDKEISEKLDKKEVNVVINEKKKENFKVEYNNEEYTYRT